MTNLIVPAWPRIDPDVPPRWFREQVDAETIWREAI